MVDVMQQLGFSEHEMQMIMNASDFNDSVVNDIFSLQSTSIRRFSDDVSITLVICYSILIVFGACGNGLVCFVVARNPQMRTPRNIFIINLAVSDLTLCLFTQPFNLIRLMFKNWVFGEFMCKFVTMFQGTNIFVSTISITAIALDRFQVIVYPTKDSMRKVGAAVSLICIWVISLLMSSPLLIFSIQKDVILGYTMCMENPSLGYTKASYAIASMIVQYFVPIIIVTIAHARICNKLKYRIGNRANRNPRAVVSQHVLRKEQREAQRKRKTNLLLIMIAVVFALSWMPLNIFNILLEYLWNTMVKYIDNSLLFAICHLLVLVSACTNPVLYGWLNDNFKREFMNALCSPCCRKLQKKLFRHATPDPEVTVTKNENSEFPTQTQALLVTINGDNAPIVTPIPSPCVPPKLH